MTNNTSQLKVTPLNELIDQFIGPLGTTRRDEWEKELSDEIREEALARQILMDTIESHGECEYKVYGQNKNGLEEWVEIRTVIQAMIKFKNLCTTNTELEGNKTEQS